MRIVIAPDKFKGSLEAPEVVEHLRRGLLSVNPDLEVVGVPMADGGEGTLDAAIGSGFERRTAQVSGPTGEPLSADFAVRGSEAVVEMALASGLAVLPGGVKDGRNATSLGTGQLISAALDAGATTIILGVGGSANTDGGAGVIRGLGARFLDAEGQDLPEGGAALKDLAGIDLSGLDPRIKDTRFILASDVDNPLLGERGAPAVFGPQKGLTDSDITDLDAALAHFVDILAEAIGEGARSSAAAPGAGAAGGVGYAALAVLNAQRQRGVDVVLQFTDLAGKLNGAALVITGEGSLDEQSLGGKTPMGVAEAAHAAAVPVVAVCGRTTLTPEQLNEAGFAAAYSLTSIESDITKCIHEAGPLVERLGAMIAQSLTADGLTDRGTAMSEQNTEAQYDLVIRGARILTSAGVAPREVAVKNGRIVAMEPLGNNLVGTEIIELAEDETLIPGLVDTHVHVNEPGRTEWEGFASATRAAAAGGVTTIVDMPLNSVPPTTSVENLEIKRNVARDQAFVDVGFWGGAIPGNTGNLRAMHDAGVFGFKCFLLHSGVDEFPHLQADEMETDMAELRTFDSLMLIHAEDSRAIDRAPHPDGDVYSKFLASRPRGAENKAITEVIERARWTQARAHILHLSSSDALPMIASAKRDGVNLTVETCPHYLTLTAEEIPNGATAYKCCPPIREASNRELLWQGLESGTIDCIVSDHSPSTLDLKDLKNGDFAVAWGGVSSLQLGLSLIWTEARHRGISLEQVIHWMATRPAEIARIPNKGMIGVGYDADFSIFAANDAFVVDVAKLKHKNPITPYDGRALSGVVRKTYLRGQLADGTRPIGKLIRRGGI